MKMPTDIGELTKHWHNWLTFDIISDLEFGESFGAAEHTTCHPPAATIENITHAGIFAEILWRVPLLKSFPVLIRPVTFQSSVASILDSFGRKSSLV